MAERKETKTKITVRDLKPKKDAKGGVSVDSTQTHQQQIHSVKNNNRNVNHMGW